MPDNGARGPLIAGGLLVVAGVFGLLAYLATHRPYPFPTPKAVSDGAASAEVNIDVYLDGSKSMRQFLKANAAGQKNYLQLLLLDIVTRLNSAHGSHASPGVEWSNATVNYWNFGAFRRGEVDPSSQHLFAKPLAVADLRQLAEHPDAGFNATRTPIEKPIVDSQGGSLGSKLKIIITDLYQSGSDTATYVDPLVNQYLEDETKAVAVIAVRNPFAGMVDDLPGCGTLQKAADTMPFYLIVAGPVGDVHHAVEVLKGTKGLSDAFEDKTTQEWFFTKAPRALTKEERMPKVFIQNTRLKGHPWKSLGDLKKTDFPKVQWIEESGLTALLMRKGVKAEVNWAPPTGVDGEEVTSGFTTDVRVSRSKDKSGSPQEDRNAKSAVQGSCESGDLDTLCFTIDEEHLKTPANYLVEIDVNAPPVRGAELPESLRPGSTSMRKWNIEVADTQNVCKAGGGFPPRAGISGSHAGMTPQLSQFLLALYDKRLNTPVRMATYSLYVKAR